MNPRKLVKKARVHFKNEKNPALMEAVKLHKELRDQGVIFALDIEEDGGLMFKTNGPITEAQSKRLESAKASAMFAAIFKYAADNDKMMLVSPALMHNLLTNTALDFV